MTGLELFSTGAWSVRAEVRDGEPWFVAADVCAALGLANVSMAVQRLDGDGVSSAEVIDTMGRTQRATIVDEGALYELIFQSRRPEAGDFRRWVTREVLPAIRRTGTYTAAPSPASVRRLPATFSEALRELADEHERSEALAAENAVLAPKAALADDLIDADGTYTVRDAAQILSGIPGVTIGAGKLRELLRSIGWIDKSARDPQPIQAQIHRGRLATKSTTFRDADGVDHVRRQIRITPKGLAELHRLIATKPQLSLVMGGAS